MPDHLGIPSPITLPECLRVLSQRDGVKANIPGASSIPLPLPSVGDSEPGGLEWDCSSFWRGFLAPARSPRCTPLPTSEESHTQPCFLETTPLYRLCPDAPGPQGLSLLQRHCFSVPNKPYLTFKNCSHHLNGLRSALDSTLTSADCQWSGQP